MEENEEMLLIGLILFTAITFIFAIAYSAFMIYCQYRVFKKAGQEGWYAIVPVYNIYIICTKIIGKDMNHFILHLIPIINIYALVITYISLAKSFGKNEGFGFGLMFLGMVFWPILAFNKTIIYQGPDKDYNPAPLIKL